ncbi:hypothetical protein CEXT_493932 [Caerostris extrusa]|nr:hypothetical protein CEXT_493932 [Caerostris extrusa]
MYAAGIRDYSILEIVNGYVQYRFDCGSGEGLVRVEHPQVNDGLWHDVCVERRGNAAEVIVDKIHRVSGNAPGVHDILNLDGNDIYFGAEVRHHPAVFGYEDIRMGFVGCMDDIRIDGAISLPFLLCMLMQVGNNVCDFAKGISCALGSENNLDNKPVTPSSPVRDVSVQGYLWDISDWASQDQTVNNNFIDESPTEGQDSSSVQSTDSNSFISQIEMLPDKNGDANTKQEQNISSTISSPSNSKVEVNPNLNNVKSKPGESPKLQFLKEDSSPPPCYDNRGSKWANCSEEEVYTYGFPKGGGRGFRKALESGDYGAVNKDAENVFLDGVDSDNVSVSDGSVKV